MPVCCIEFNTVLQITKINNFIFESLFDGVAVIEQKALTAALQHNEILILAMVSYRDLILLLHTKF